MADLRNRRARLTSAYHELGRQLTSGKFTIIGNYTLQRTIGQGTYGKVRLATHRLTNSRVAVKQIPKEHVASLTREIHHHRRLHHPNVLQLYEVIQSESCIWMVTELCAGGELYDYVVDRGSLSEYEARDLFAQLCLAVAYIHANGIVHRDLKLENILLDAHNRIKLSDFGFTREYEPHQLLRTQCGTTAYAAPEMLAGKRYQGPEVDIWSLGVILFVLLCGFLPFDDDNEAQMQWKIVNTPAVIPTTLSDDAQNLLRLLLNKNGSERPTIRQILSHPWYTRPRISRSASRSSSLDLPRYPTMRSLSPTESESMGAVPVNYLAMLTQPLYEPFEGAVEQQLFHSLQTLGFAVGQIRHSVQTNACDAAGALWWLLLQKAKEASAPQNLALGITGTETPVQQSTESLVPRNLYVTQRERTSHEGAAPALRSPELVAPSMPPNKPQAPLELHAPHPISGAASFASEESTPSLKKHRSIISSVKSWLKKDRKDSDSDDPLQPQWTSETVSETPFVEEPGTAPLAPPLLPSMLVSNNTYGLAPAAGRSGAVTPSESLSAERSCAPELSPVLASRLLDTPSLRRTSSLARPGSAYGRRVSVGSATSTPLRRERSYSLHSRQSSWGSGYMRSRQSSWNSIRPVRSRRGSESTVFRKRVVPQRGSMRVPDSPAQLSRRMSVTSETNDTRPTRPISMDEEALASLQRYDSSSSVTKDAPTTLFFSRRNASPFQPPRPLPPVSPRTRPALPRNVGGSSETEPKVVSPPATIPRKKKVMAPHAEDDWIDEEVQYAGGIGQLNEHIPRPADPTNPEQQRQRRGSPCPPRMLRPTHTTDDEMPKPLPALETVLGAPVAMRGKKIRRDMQAPVIEEEEP